MANNELLNKIEALNEWEALMEEAKAEAEALRDSIKQEMMERGTEELECGQYIIRWTSVLTQRFDTTSFKKAMPDVYKSFIKQSASKRFSMISWNDCMKEKKATARNTYTMSRFTEVAECLIPSYFILNQN